MPTRQFAPGVTFALGGFIFGIGTSLNQGCSVSTLTQLARGNLHMIFTIIGWVAGWSIWTLITPFTEPPVMGTPPDSVIMILIGTSLVVTVWAVSGNVERRRLWGGVMMGAGASLCLGGNDAQLLTALPVFSPAGILTVVFMIAGITLGMDVCGRIRKRFLPSL